MDYDHEIHSLAAETMALTSVVGFLLNHLANSGSRLSVASALESAANHVTGIALSGRGVPEHTTKALLIIDQLRETALGK